MQAIVFVLSMIGSSVVYAHPGAHSQTAQGGYVYSYQAGTPVPSPNNPAESCITDVCGPPAQSNLYMTKYLDRLSEYLRLSSDPQQVDFPPTISKTFADFQAEVQKQNDKALALFRKSSSLGDAQARGISKALYNISYALPYLQKLKYKVTTVGGKPVTTVDEAASASALKDLSPEDRSWMLQVGKYYIAAYLSSPVSENAVQTQPAGLLLKQLHPGLSTADAMKLELSKAQANIASLKGLSPIENAIFFSNTTPDRIPFIAAHVAGGTVDENETREIIKWNRDYINNNALFRNQDSPIMTRPTPPIEEIIKKQGGAEAVAESFIQDRAEDQRKDEAKIQSCKMQYFLNKGLLPTKEQINTLNQDIARSKQMVEDTIKSKFPRSMQQKLIRAVENADFITPPTASDFERSFADSLRQKLQTQKSQAVAMDSISPADGRQLLTSFAVAKSAKDPNEKDDSNDFCDAFKYSPMSDGNYTTYGSIMLSFTTATGNESSRLNTIMHELGHTVSKVIADDPQSAQQFAGVRKCLADQHTEEPPPQTKKSYDEALATDSKTNGPYVEEDLADMISGESGKNVPGKNPWCQLLSLTYDRQQYQESSMQADDGDSHSASLFRLLNFQTMNTGSMPDSCKTYLSTLHYSEHFSSCLDLANPTGTSDQPAKATK